MGSWGIPKCLDHYRNGSVSTVFYDFDPKPTEISRGDFSKDIISQLHRLEVPPPCLDCGSQHCGSRFCVQLSCHGLRVIIVSFVKRWPSSWLPDPNIGLRIGAYRGAEPAFSPQTGALSGTACTVFPMWVRKCASSFTAYFHFSRSVLTLMLSLVTRLKEGVATRQGQVISWMTSIFPSRPHAPCSSCRFSPSSDERSAIGAGAMSSRDTRSSPYRKDAIVNYQTELSCILHYQSFQRVRELNTVWSEYIYHQVCKGDWIRLRTHW